MSTENDLTEKAVEICGWCDKPVDECDCDEPALPEPGPETIP